MNIKRYTEYKMIIEKYEGFKEITFTLIHDDYKEVMIDILSDGRIVNMYCYADGIPIKDLDADNLKDIKTFGMDNKLFREIKVNKNNIINILDNGGTPSLESIEDLETVLNIFNKYKIPDNYSSDWGELIEEKIINEHKYFKTEYDGLMRDILSVLNFYNNEESDDILNEAKKIYSKVKNKFKNTVVNHNDSFYFEPDTTPRVVYHSSNDDFDVFNTPSFFAENSAAYSGDIIYSCIINIEKPLHLDSKFYIREYGKEEGIKKWKEIIRDILGQEEYNKREEFIDNYLDGYGLFRIIQSSDVDYNWNIIYKYVRDNNYDGVLYRESDESIRNFFTGYLVMKPNQIIILNKENQD